MLFSCWHIHHGSRSILFNNICNHYSVSVEKYVRAYSKNAYIASYKKCYATNKHAELIR